MSLASILLGSARGTKLPKSFQPLLTQALSEAAVRYTPEFDQLSQLRQNSAQTMRQSIGQAQSAAQLNAALAGQAQQNFSSAQSPLVQRMAQYDHPPANSSAAVVAQNLGLTHDATSSMLAQAAANAPIRAEQQGLQAQALHAQDLAKIQGQRASLLGQAGNYITGRYGGLVGTDRSNRAKVTSQKRQIASQLAQTDARLAVTTRGQDLSHADRQAALDARNNGPGKLPGGVKLNTPGQHGALKDSVSSATAVVQQQRKLGRSRREIAGLLINGRPAQTITLSPGDPGYDPANPAKNKVSAPALPKIPQLALSVALDQAFDQHVSGHNVNELHRRGYSVKTLGFGTTPPPPKPRRAPARKVTLGPAGPLS